MKKGLPEAQPRASEQGAPQEAPCDGPPDAPQANFATSRVGRHMSNKTAPLTRRRSRVVVQMKFGTKQKRKREWCLRSTNSVFMSNQKFTGKAQFHALSARISLDLHYTNHVAVNNDALSHTLASS